MMPSWLRTLCKVEWPTVGVGWPPKGTMDFNTVSLCHSYRKIWTPQSVPIHRLLSRDSPGTSQMGLILYPKWGGENINGSKSNQRWKGDLTESREGRTSPATVLDDDPTNQHSRGAESLPTGNWPEAGKHPRTFTFTCPPDSPTGCKLLFRQAPTLVEGTTGYNTPDSTTADIIRPKLYPPLPISTSIQGEGDVGIKQRLCSAREPEGKAPLQMTLRDVQQPPMYGKDGNYYQAPIAYYYQPFSSTDIPNWQKHTPLTQKSHKVWLDWWKPSFIPIDQHGVTSCNYRHLSPVLRRGIGLIWKQKNGYKRWFQKVLQTQKGG